MCQTVTCATCGKITWSGCGQHIEQAMRGVRPADRCAGHEQARPTGFLARLFGR